MLSAIITPGNNRPLSRSPGALPRRLSREPVGEEPESKYGAEPKSLGCDAHVLSGMAV